MTQIILNLVRSSPSSVGVCQKTGEGNRNKNLEGLGTLGSEAVPTSSTTCYGTCLFQTHALVAKQKPKRYPLTRASRSSLPTVPPPDESQKKLARSPRKDGGAEKGPTRESPPGWPCYPLTKTQSLKSGPEVLTLGPANPNVNPLPWDKNG